MFALSTTKRHNNIQQLDLQVSRNGQQLRLCFDVRKWDRVVFLGLISVPISTCRGEHLGFHSAAWSRSGQPCWKTNSPAHAL